MRLGDVILKRAVRAKPFKPQYATSRMPPRIPLQTRSPPDVFLSQDLCEAIAPPNSMQKEEGIADVAFPGSIGADKDGKRTELQGRVLEILELLQTQ